MRKPTYRQMRKARARRKAIYQSLALFAVTTLFGTFMIHLTLLELSL